MITPAFVTHVFGGPPPAPGGGWDTFGIVGTASAATPDVEDHKFNAAGAPLWPTSRTNANGDSADVGYVASPLNDGTGTGDIRFGGFVNSNIGVTAAFRIRPHPDDLGQDFFAVAALTLVHSGFDIGVQLNVDGGAPIVDFTSAAQGSSSAYHLDDRVFFSSVTWLAEDYLGSPSRILCPTVNDYVELTVAPNGSYARINSFRLYKA